MSKTITLNPHRISLNKLANILKYNNIEDMLLHMTKSNTILACCKNKCQIDYQSYCIHGCPSPFLAMGLID